MPASVYSEAQIDALMAIVGNRITNETDPETVRAFLNALADTNFVTDAQLAAIATIEPTKYKGSFADLASIPTVGAGSGDYATIIVAGGDDTNAIWDDDAGAWIDTGSAVTGETAATVKSKYESNADTNALTDALLTKLNDLSIAASTASAIAALDGSIT